MKLNLSWFLAVMATAMVACENVVPFLDTVPIVSQLKAVFQLATGDKKGATETQEHYINEGIGPAQARSAYFLVTGNPGKALEIQKKFVKNMEVLLDGTPVIGHVKGAIHLITGDKEHGWEAIKSATSTTGSAIGGVFGGPVGAIVGHTITDAAISGVDAAINGNNSQPFGLIGYALHIDELRAGDHFDMLAGLVMDGTTGKFVKNKKTGSKPEPTVSENQNMLHERIKDSEIESPPQHESSPMSEKRIGTQPTLNVQLVRRTMTDVTTLGPAEVKNNIAFHKFIGFVRDTSIYRFYYLTNVVYRDIVSRTFNGLQELRYTNNLMNININTIKSQLDYLTDPQKSLITRDDFRTVNTMPNEIKNCLGCAVAGTLKIDVETFFSRLGPLDMGAYDPRSGSILRYFFETCRQKNILNFEMSPYINGIESLYHYLKANSLHLENKQLIMAAIGGLLEGHVFVLRFKMVDGLPVTVFVDYQLPGFLDVNLPNPFRISPYIDTTNFDSFRVIKVSEP